MSLNIPSCLTHRTNPSSTRPLLLPSPSLLLSGRRVLQRQRSSFSKHIPWRLLSQDSPLDSQGASQRLTTISFTVTEWQSLLQSTNDRLLCSRDVQWTDDDVLDLYLDSCNIWRWPPSWWRNGLLLKTLELDRRCDEHVQTTPNTTINLQRRRTETWWW